MRKSYETDAALLSVTTEFENVMQFHNRRAKTVTGDNSIYDVAAREFAKFLYEKILPLEEGEVVR